MLPLLKTKNSKISAVTAKVPKKRTDNDFFSYLGDAQSLEKAVHIIGVEKRYWSEDNQTAADLCCEAAKDIFSNTKHTPDQIDALIFVSQSPNYQMPATVFEIHKTLDIKEEAICLDINLGCSGYVNGLYLAQNLIESGLEKVLLLAGEAPSKYVDTKDQGTVILFGDAGSATILEKSSEPSEASFRFKTRGCGFDTISIPSGIHKKIDVANSKDSLYMNGPEVFNFTIKEIPAFIKDHIRLAEKKIEDYDYILLHQANLFMLNHIYKKTGASEDQKFININKYGNTSSATLPLLLTDKDFDLNQNSNLLLAGFGVGLSWGTADILIKNNVYRKHIGG